MKKLLRIVLLIVGVLILGMAGLLSYVKFALPRVAEAPDLNIEITPARLERGEYLARYVSGCFECHSTRDWNTFSAPLVPGMEGVGGFAMTREMGMPGLIHASNITPVGLGDWTDGEVFRALTSGVSRDGRALFPVMPYHTYGKMDKEDIYAIIAYIRTLEPKGENHPLPEYDFPMGLIVNLIPDEPEFQDIPDPADDVAYGAYMATAGGCVSCHSTQDEQGRMIEGMLLAGGTEFILPPYGTVRSSNLTPDVETGIGRWSEDAFVARLKAYADSGISLPKVGPGDFQTLMSWTLHAHMKESDLRAIYRYIQTAPPVSNKVERFTAMEP